MILTLDSKQTGGEWMDTLNTDWMLPQGDTLALPDGSEIPTRLLELTASESRADNPQYKPTWLATDEPPVDTLPLRLSPSAIAPTAAASIGRVITLGERLEIEGAYDPAALGSALHAVIATTLLGQTDTARVLGDHGMDATISVAAANESCARLLTAINAHFDPVNLHVEYPVTYTDDNGQIISGWIDLLVETAEGFVLIDHKASPRARSDWEEIALGYSGQLDAYAKGVTQATGCAVTGRWIHFGVTGGLVEVC